MLGWLWAFIIGLVVGVIAKLLMPGKDPGGFIVTGLLGIAGSLVATFIGQAVGWYRPGQSAGWILSIAGAVVLLALYRVFTKQSGGGGT